MTVGMEMPKDVDHKSVDNSFAPHETGPFFSYGLTVCPNLCLEQIEVLAVLGVHFVRS